MIQQYPPSALAINVYFASESSADRPPPLEAPGTWGKTKTGLETDRRLSKHGFAVALIYSIVRRVFRKAGRTPLPATFGC